MQQSNKWTWVLPFMILGVGYGVMMIVLFWWTGRAIQGEPALFYWFVEFVVLTVVLWLGTLILFARRVPRASRIPLTIVEAVLHALLLSGITALSFLDDPFNVASLLIVMLACTPILSAVGTLFVEEA